MNKVLCTILVAVALVTANTLPLQRVTAQDVAAGGRPETGEISRATAALLARAVTVHVESVSLPHAIEVVAASANVRISFNRSVLDAYAKPVTVVAKNLPLGTVCERLLAGTDLRVIGTSDNQLAIIMGEPMAKSTSGLLLGTVTSAKTKRPLRGVSIILGDSTVITRTNESGQYRFPNVASGSYKVTARSIGYARQTKPVTVRDDQTTTLDFLLESSVNALDQVVVTATGEQRIRELGHVVTRINVDSLVKVAPITSVTDLLIGRVPGLVALTGSGGVAGANVQLRLRGATSASLSSEPIVIVDGVRYRSSNSFDGSNGGDYRAGNVGDIPSPLNDLNPNDIETIEIAKGPSASTLYGPDAANGVILITTKHGKSGKTEFNWYARPVTNNIPEDRVPRFRYNAWGHVPGTTDLYPYGNCTLVSQYVNQSCVLDSITKIPTQINDPNVSVIAKNRPTWQYGGSLTAGVPSLRYFASANYNSQTGVMRLSPVADSLLRALYGVSSIANSVRTPNTLQDLTFHTTVNADVNPRATVGISASYTQSTNQRVNVGNFFSQLVSGPQPGSDTTSSLYQPDPTFSINTVGEQSNRLTASIDGHDQIVPWLNVNGTVGLDIGAITTHAVHPGNALGQYDPGSAEDDRRNVTGRTVNAGAIATAHPHALSFRTSLGVQYNYSHQDGVNTIGGNLAPASGSIGTATQIYATPQWAETVTLGTYAEEVVGLRDRLYLTASLRVDGSTSFGDAYHPTPYPKVGVSWIVSDEPFWNMPGVSQLRLRASYGGASRYPTSTMKLGNLGADFYTFGGQTVVGFDRGYLSNPVLRPERTREAEYGADATLLSNITLGLSWYHRKTLDQLHNITNPTGLQSVWENTASIAAHGFEATLNIPIVETRMIRGDLNFAYSYGTDRVLSLGSAPNVLSTNGGGYAVGAPLSAVFGQRILKVLDTVGTGSGNSGDGIVFPQEIVRDSIIRFLGVTTPPRTYTLAPTVTLFGGRISISSLFDRSTGYLVLDSYSQQCVSSGLCLAPLLKTTPLLEQAKYVAQFPHLEDFLEPGDNTRWRELNISVDVPSRFLRIDPLHLHFSRGSVSLQGRNLKLWTAFKGPDPDSRDDPLFINAIVGGIPQARAWSFRFDLTP